MSDRSPSKMERQVGLPLLSKATMSCRHAENEDVCTRAAHIGVAQFKE